MNGIGTQMEVDTGAAVSIASQDLFQQLSSNDKRVHLEPTVVKLKSYSGHELQVLGECRVHVDYQGQSKDLPLLIVKGHGPNLMGRNWLSHLRLDWNSIQQIKETEKSVESLVSKYREVFKEGLGKLKGVTARIHIEAHATPIFLQSSTSALLPTNKGRRGVGQTRTGWNNSTDAVFRLGLTDSTSYET